MDDTNHAGPWGPQARITVADLAEVRTLTEAELDLIASTVGRHRRSLDEAEADHEAACRILEDADATRAQAARRVEHTAHALQISRDQYAALAARVIR